MRKMVLSVGMTLCTLIVPLATHMPRAQALPTAAGAQARVIVKYRADSALLKRQAASAASSRSLQATALGSRIGVPLSAGIGITDRSHVVFATGLSSNDLASRIASQSDVEYAVPDERKRIVAVPNDPYYPARAYDSASSPTSGGPLVGQWYLKSPDSTGTPANTAPAAINAEQAWDLTMGSAAVVVADIDTGLRFDHPDLQGGNMLPGYDMISADTDGRFTTANDGDGRDPDASDPGDWVDAASNADPNSPLYRCGVSASSWHGTQTAGLIGAATGNDVGMASVGRTVRVLPVRVLGRCGGYDSDIQAGMLWAAGIAVPDVPANANPARVLNMSLGGTGGCNAAYQDTVNQVVAAGTSVVVATGNSGGNSVGAPANCQGVIAVSALRSAGDKVGFSDLGPEVAISSPGGNCVNTGSGQPCLYSILTTSNAGATTPVTGAAGGIYTDSFNASLGTSFSTPLVSGTIALMLSAMPSLTPAQVKAGLQRSARAFPTTGGSAGIATCVAPTANSNEDECYCTVSTCGAGMLDAHAAVLAALGVRASISDATPTPTAGSPVVLTSTSAVGTGGTIASYAWAVTDAGTTAVTITSGQGTSSLTLLPTAAGSFSVSLTVTDAFGNSSASTLTVSVAPSATVTASTASSGGGAIGAGWLLFLSVAVVALAMQGLSRK
jgi:serine protease